MAFVRRGTVLDASDIANIHVKSWQRIYKGIMPDHVLNDLSVPERKKLWESWIANRTEVLVIEEKNIVLGFISFGRVHDSLDAKHVAEISAIYIAPDRWRNGYGRQLLLKAELKAKESGFSEMTLWVLEKNTRGRLFYESMGYNETPTVKVDNSDGVELKEILYRKFLLT
ncbi:MAG: GNAT family N-acetyltransferase [Gammaproteobacteria bacterium]